jgi:hypothetical protein
MIFLRALFLAAAFFSALLGAEPEAVYLTMQHAPERAMTICWIEQGALEKQELKVRQAGTIPWMTAVSCPASFPSSYPSSYHLHAVELQGLAPDTCYEFTLPDAPRSFFFRTFPERLSRPVKLVVGGDIYHDGSEVVASMNRVAAAQDPDAAILGGDIAYACSRLFFLPDDGKRWIRYLKIWSETMIRRDGTLIPLLAVIGNHDVNGGFDQTPDQAQSFYFFFPSQEKKYRTLDFGDYLTVWLMDSGHTHPIEGEQTRWLAETLKQSQNPFKFAIYHVPAYPSVRKFTNEKSTMVRRCWSPLFEAFKITAAFEHHDHTYKRTCSIRDGKQDPQGILYFGDGAWGVETPRRPRSPSHAWYLAKTASTRHVILVTLQGMTAYFQAIDSEGRVFDSVSASCPQEVPCAK